MKVRLMFGWLIVLSLVAAIGYAQNPPAPGTTQTLSLSEATAIARRSNPTYRAALNDRAPAGWARRAAFTTLFIPTSRVSGTYFQRARGDSDFFGTTEFPSPAFYDRSLSFDFNYSLSGATLAQRGLAEATLRSVDAATAGALTQLDTDVRAAYLNALEARANEARARQALTRASELVALARARQAVGQGTLIEVRRNEVTEGQAEVGVLTAVQNTQAQTLRLFQVLGVPMPLDVAIQLTDSFPVAALNVTREQLVQQALTENPQLRSSRARESAAKWQTRADRSAFLPTFSLNFGKGSGTNHTFTALPETSLTRVYRDPWSFSLTLSLPLFDNFNRNVRVAQSRAAQEDRALEVRQAELQLRTDVSTAFHAMQQAFQTIAIQQRNREYAREALELATQRYRVGSGSYIELLDARVVAEDAEAAYITAVYTYHRSIATLENAVGRPLR